jgi:cytochrome c-type biogenesis protein CcmH
MKSLNKLLWLILLLVIPAGVCLAQTPESEAHRLADRVMSPYCPGRTLSACPSDDARTLRDKILAEFKSGKTVEQIERDLVAQYGRDVLGMPESAGFGKLGWGAPILFLIIGGGIVFLALRKGGAEQQTDASPEMIARVEKELEERLKSKES